MKSIAFAAAVVLAAIPAVAQTGNATPAGQQPPVSAAVAPEALTPASYKNEVRIQELTFGNFYQASIGQPTQSVNAFGVGYRGTYRPRGMATDFYGDVSFLRFTSIDRPNPYGLRVGAKYEGPVQAYDVFVDRGGHRAAFDVGNRTAIATVTTINGEYTYKLTNNWQAGAELTRESQRFDVDSDEKNDFTRAGVSMRYRGFGYKFSPRVGYDFGRRDVVNRSESYDERYWFAGFSSSPTSRSYVSLTYRGRHRNYSPRYAVAGDFSARDERPEWSSFGLYRFSRRLSANYYYSHDTSRSPLAWRNFNTSFLLLGVTTSF